MRTSDLAHRIAVLRAGLAARVRTRPDLGRADVMALSRRLDRLIVRYMRQARNDPRA